MSGLFAHPTFAGFGPNRFDPLGERPNVVTITGTNAADLREGVRLQAPRLPGVYGMIDPRGRLIYVGKAKVLRARLMSYFRTASRDPKAGRIIKQTRWLTWEEGPHEFSALLRELELIRKFRPSHNVLGQPGRQRFVYLCLGRSPAATFFVSREPPPSAAHYYGPLGSPRLAKESARRLNDWFRLRDCSPAPTMWFADQPTLFHESPPGGCLRFDIGTCSGPCVGGTSRANYGRLAREARAFLDGRNDQPIERLEREMFAAAAAARFEQAAAIRDRLTPLKWIQERLSWLQKARFEHTFVYSLRDAHGREIWLLIHRGRVLKTMFAPTTNKDRRLATAAIHTVYPVRGDPPAFTFADSLDSILLAAAWFRKFPAERANCITPMAALERCGVKSAAVA